MIDWVQEVFIVAIIIIGAASWCIAIEMMRPKPESRKSWCVKCQAEVWTNPVAHCCRCSEPISGRAHS